MIELRGGVFGLGLGLGSGLRVLALLPLGMVVLEEHSGVLPNQGETWGFREGAVIAVLLG